MSKQEINPRTGKPYIMSKKDRQILSKKIRKALADPTVKAKHRAIMQKLHADPEFQAKRGKAIAAAHARPEVKANVVAAAKRKWARWRLDAKKDAKGRALMKAMSEARWRKRREKKG